MKLAMIGTGYVGLVSAACLADFGHVVTCVDKDVAKLDMLLRGEMPIYEPGLDELVNHNVAEGRLRFTTDIDAAVGGADAVFIAVGTPSRREDDRADLSYVFAAAEEIARAMTGFTVVAVKSTVPVGTGDEIERIIRRVRPEADAVVVSNPEFLREGFAISDFKHPDRIVVGLDDQRGRVVMHEIYRVLYLDALPILFTRRRTGELIKCAANAFLATKITFINEIADICEMADADVQEVARGIGLDNRIGPKFLRAGPGFGGSCFPKDIRALAETARDLQTPSRIVEAVRTANEERKTRMFERIVGACGGSVEGKTIAVLGLTFKPDTDDMRESPSIPIISQLQRAGARICCFDPAGMDQSRAVLDDVRYARDPYECAEGAQAVCILTEWNAFRALDLARLKAVLAEPLVIDLRNIYRLEDMQREGIRYISIGRPDIEIPVRLRLAKAG
ncbi:MAG: UDP-glucose/GDP-mannose dehydrogenase family protein [Flavobacteriaceae bacterium]